MREFLDDPTIRGEPGQPVAISTKVGWLLSGPVEEQSNEKVSSINFPSTYVLRVESEPSKEDLSKLWGLDSTGIYERLDDILSIYLGVSITSFGQITMRTLF